MVSTIWNTEYCCVRRKETSDLGEESLDHHTATSTAHTHHANARYSPTQPSQPPRAWFVIVVECWNTFGREKASVLAKSLRIGTSESGGSKPKGSTAPCGPAHVEWRQRGVGGLACFATPVPEKQSENILCTTLSYRGQGPGVTAHLNRSLAVLIGSLPHYVGRSRCRAHRCVAENRPCACRSGPTGGSVTRFLMGRGFRGSTKRRQGDGRLLGSLQVKREVQSDPVQRGWQLIIRGVRWDRWVY